VSLVLDARQKTEKHFAYLALVPLHKTKTTTRQLTACKLCSGYKKYTYKVLCRMLVLHKLKWK